MLRYRVVYSTDTAGSRSEFSAADDSAAWAHAEQYAYGACVVLLAEVQTRPGYDELRELTRPHACPDPAYGPCPRPKCGVPWY